jgi:hypothetical protein
MSRFDSRGRWAARALLVSACGVSVCGLTLIASGTALAQTARAASPAAQAATAPAATATVTLGNDGAAVKTSNGQSWTLIVGDSSTADTLTIGIVRTVTAGGSGAEEHIWFFDSPASSLAFNKTTGDGTVTGGSTTSPLATVGLTFTATSHKAASCSSGSETIYTGTLSGEAKLVTGLTGGGTVGGSSLTFTAKGSSPEVLVDSGCVPPEDGCTAATLFISGATGATTEAAGFAGTESGKKFNFVSVTRKVTLTSPKGAYRIDTALDLATSAPSWNPKTDVLSVSTTSSGIVTGSATLSGGKPKTVSYPCSYGGKSYTLTETDDMTANYASPAGEAITGHTSLTGNLAAPSSAKDATYVVTTVS